MGKGKIMNKTIINSYISEFKHYKNEIMSNVNECKDNSLVGTVYGQYQSLKEFWYNKKDKTGYIFVNGVKIDVTDY
jgi:predicted small secreted protein